MWKLKTKTFYERKGKAKKKKKENQMYEQNTNKGNKIADIIFYGII